MCPINTSKRALLLAYASRVSPGPYTNCDNCDTTSAMSGLVPPTVGVVVATAVCLTGIYETHPEICTSPQQHGFFFDNDNQTPFLPHTDTQTGVGLLA
jgi:hypothetical protein